MLYYSSISLWYLYRKNQSQKPNRVHNYPKEHDVLWIYRKSHTINNRQNKLSNVFNNSFFENKSMLLLLSADHWGKIGEGKINHFKHFPVFQSNITWTLAQYSYWDLINYFNFVGLCYSEIFLDMWLSSSKEDLQNFTLAVN